MTDHHVPPWHIAVWLILGTAGWTTLAIVVALLHEIT